MNTQMNVLKSTRQFQFSLFLGVALALSACSGDGRPLLEAVETNQLELGSIEIKQPTGLLAPLFVDPGQQINFSVMATTKSDDGEPVVELPLSVANRRWSVASVDGAGNATTGRATIDDNGKFIGTADGVVTVNLQIGGLTDSFPVTIAEGVLTDIAINPAESVVDPETGEAVVNSLERCLPEMYVASGTYTDTSATGMSTRGLQNQNIEWSTSNPALGSAGSQLNGSTTVTAFEAGMLDLIATVVDMDTGDVVSSTESIEVVPSLQSINISPDTAGLMAGTTLQLTANGTYMRDGGESISDITDSVTWSLLEDNGAASVSNEGSDKGLVTGNAVGNVNVTAACGMDPIAMRNVVVIQNDGSASGNLAFEDGPIITITEGQSLQLRVSTGSIYDEENDITSDINTTFTVSSGANIVAFQSGNNGEITALNNATDDFSGATDTAEVTVLVDGEGDDVPDAQATLTIVVQLI